MYRFDLILFQLKRKLEIKDSGAQNDRAGCPANKNFNRVMADSGLLRALVLMLRQDDPSKCTAAKLAKFRIAEAVRSPQRDSIVLNPFSTIPVTRADSSIATSICAIDCSWERADSVLRAAGSRTPGIPRRLPRLLAGNPVNYAKLGKLSTAEALAAGLYIMGDTESAARVMNKFKWGHTFLELNADPLQEYSAAEDVLHLVEIEKSYFSDRD